MADEHLTAADAAFRLVSLTPDVCLTPMGSSLVPVPYPITHMMDASRQCSADVFVNGKPAFLHGTSYVADVTGDEAGTRGGVVSGVHQEVSHGLDRSASVFVNGRPVVRTGDQVHMNTREP